MAWVGVLKGGVGPVRDKKTSVTLQPQILQEADNPQVQIVHLSELRAPAGRLLSVEITALCKMTSEVKIERTEVPSRKWKFIMVLEEVFLRVQPGMLLFS